MWTNALFAVQIHVCQLVVEPRNFAGCLIYVGHINLIACFFIINIFNTTFVTKNCTLLKITQKYIWQQNRGPHSWNLLDPSAASIMMTSSNGKIFRVSPLFGEFTGPRWIPRTQASDAELWWFLWSAPWINGWVNNGEAGDLRHHRAHYDVIVMITTTHISDSCSEPTTEWHLKA